MVWLIKFIVFSFSVFVFLKIIFLYLNTKGDLVKTPSKPQLLFTGFVANVADTLGIGSFAVVVAFNNRWKFVDDKRLPGTLNAHSVLPAMLQSLLFLNFVDMDLRLLSSFVLAACFGGLVSGLFVSKLDKQSIRFLMTIGFALIALLIIANQTGLLPVGGDETTLPPAKILIGIPAMFIAGMLPAIGAGLYAPILIILFFLGLSPLIAFPIMTTTGAIVQSATALAFVSKKEVAVRESLFMSFSGLAGVAVAVPLVTYVNPASLRWLLLFIVLYNLVTMGKAYLQEKSKPVEV